MQRRKPPIRFGSPDSVDVDSLYVFDTMPSFQECKRFCDGGEDNRNIIVVQDGVIKDCYKGLPDEMNNALFYTYDLHEQVCPNPVKRPVRRIAPLKVVRASRIVLSQLSRSQYRPKIKPALRSHDFSERKQVLSEINFTKVNASVDCLKSVAFQIGQAIAVIEGNETHTKADLANRFEDLRPFLYRKDGADPNVLNAYRDRLLGLLSGVYSRRKNSLNLFCYENAPAIKEWNQFNSQCRGIVIDLKGERCVYYPSDKFFRIGEVPETAEDRLPKDVPVEIVEKVDGSMACCFKHDGEIIFACKGNFDVAQSQKAEELSGRYRFDQLDFGKYFHVFEVIYPENRFPGGLSVVDYGGREELVMVGLRDKLTNEMQPYSVLREEANKHSLPSPRFEQKSLGEIIALMRADDGPLREEGWVARFANGLYVKIKYRVYMNVLKAVNDMRSKRFVRRHLEFGEAERAENLSQLPSDIKNVALSQLEDFRTVQNQIEEYYRRTLLEHGPEFPQFALGSVPRDFQKSLLRCWRDQPYDAFLEKIALKVYTGKLDMPDWLGAPSEEAGR